MENSFFIEKLKEANEQIDEKSFEKAGNTLNQVPEEFKEIFDSFIPMANSNLPKVRSPKQVKFSML